MIKETIRAIDQGLSEVMDLKIFRLLPRTGKIAAVPGTVKYVGKEKEEDIKLTLFSFDEKGFSETELSSLPVMSEFDEQRVHWLNISGVHDEKIINMCGENFGIHPLVLEDIANTTHRPKTEEYESYIFAILKMVYYDYENTRIEFEQISLVAGRNYLITFQERQKDVLDGVRGRIRTGRGRVRKERSDYLMYAVADSIVDHYYRVLEHIAMDIEDLESELLLSADKEILTRIYGFKQELVYLRKFIWPIRDALSRIQKTEHELIGETASLYFRDVYDHAVQVLETVEIFGEKASGMLELYMTMVSNKMNEVMKVLTIFAAIFIPLTFMAGVYGMNFEFMPELKSPMAYPVWWTAVLIVGLVMVLFFRRKKWL